MKLMFAVIQEFIEEHDDYDTESKVTVEFKASYEPPTFLQVTKAVINIFRTSGELGEVLMISSFQEAMKRLSEIYKVIFKSFSTFCTCEDEEKLIARLAYIVNRGIIEFSRLYDVKPESISEFKLSLNDAFQIEMGETQFIEMILTKINPDLMINLFNTFELLEEFEDFISEFETKTGKT